MAKNFNAWILEARSHKSDLDTAMTDKNNQAILVSRGRYIRALRNAQKLNPGAVIPPAISGLASPVDINTLIKYQLNLHRNHINKYSAENKKSKTHSLSKEIGLKFKRIAATKAQLRHATSNAEKSKLNRQLVKDSASLAGSALLKAPIVTTAKVASKIGPLAITIGLLPFKVFTSLLSVTIDVFNGDVKNDVSSYNNTFIDDLSKPLKDFVRKTFNTIDNKVSRI